jgi:hypothetical protein
MLQNHNGQKFFPEIGDEVKTFLYSQVYGDWGLLPQGIIREVMYTYGDTTKVRTQYAKSEQMEQSILRESHWCQELSCWISSCDNRDELALYIKEYGPK